MKKLIRKLILFIILLDLILNYSIIQTKVYAEPAGENLESKYSIADIIPENTKIRNQMQTPWCLSFASLATLESSLAIQDKNAGKTAKEYDFSEEHMAYSTQDSSFKDGKINKKGLHKNVNDGASLIAIQEYFSNGMGVVNEEDYPFDNSTGNIDISKLNQPIAATVLDTFVFPQLSIKSTSEFSKDKISDLIKEMKTYIKKYGGITATLATGGANKNKYINWSNNSLNNPENISLNSLDHAVCIIGWDDNYSKDKISDLIKEMKTYIKKYGGITATLATGGANKNKYINWSNNSLNNPENIALSSLDHAVCIIGWDDNYSKDNFNTNYKPKNNGAWIVKNSWGNIVELGNTTKLKEEVFDQIDESTRKQYNINSSNDITDEILIHVLEELFTGLTNIRIVNGVAYGDRDSKSFYMYISYETPSIYVSNMGVTKAELGKNYDNLYQYDEFGPTKHINISNGNVYMANVFKRDASRDEKLTRVSIYSPKKQNYQIFVNPDNSKKTINDLKQVSVNGNQKTVTLDSGFHTLEIEEPLELTGDSFVVVVKASNDDNNSQISVETKCSSEEDPKGLLSNVEVSAGQSFFSIDDNLKENNWTDMLNLKLSDGTAIPSNANIKAYTKEYSKENENNNNIAENNTIENNATENNTTENNIAENNTTENSTTKNNTAENNTIEEKNVIKEQNGTIDNTDVNNNSKNNNTENASKTNSGNNSSNNEKNNGKDDIDVLQTKLENNKYITTSPNLMQTSETSKDLTVATKKIPKAGENRVILYAIIFISIIASTLFIKYYKINKIMKS